MNTEKSSEAVRRARRELHSKVRSDWDEVLSSALLEQVENPANRPHDTSANGTPTSSTAATNESAEEERYPFRRRSSRHAKAQNEAITQSAPHTAGGKALEWRERTYASSDPSSDEELSSPNLSQRLGFLRKRGSVTEADNFNGEEQLDRSRNKEERRRAERKRRRRKRLEDEMADNPGLCYWERRRDLWCMARDVSSLPSDVPGSDSTSSSTSTSLSTSHSSVSLNPFEPQTSSQSQNASPDAKKPVAGVATAQHSSQIQSQSQPSTGRMIPVAPPMLNPDDPTRQQITPTAYASIFNKLVTQSLAPSVPINLSHVVPALVQGWKDTGEWPPGQPVSAAAPPPNNSSRSSRQHAASGVAAAAGAAVVRKLRIVDEAASKGKRRLGRRGSSPVGEQNSPREPAEAGEDDGNAAGDQAQGPTDGAAAGSGEKDGVGTPTSGSTSPLKARMNAMRDWVRR